MRSSSDNWKEPHVIKVIWNSQHGFMKVKLCLTNLIAFCDGMSGWVVERIFFFLILARLSALSPITSSQTSREVWA